LLTAWLAARGGLRRPAARRAAAVALMGVLYVAQSACFFGSLRTVPAAVTSILLYTYPVVVALLARALLGEALGAVGTCALVAAASAFLAGLAGVGPSVASTVSTLEPASTAVMAAAFLGESLSPLRWAGGALVLAAAAVLARATATAARERVADTR